jgi:large subunit ribosomal protein L18
MAKNNRTVARQKRHKRVRKHVSGTSSRPRLAVFRSLTDIYAQIIDDESGVTLISASSIDNELRTSMSGKSKIEQASLVGEAVASRASGKGITTIVFDRGGFRYTGRVKALADAARKAGLVF